MPEGLKSWRQCAEAGRIPGGEQKQRMPRSAGHPYVQQRLPLLSMEGQLWHCLTGLARKAAGIIPISAGAERDIAVWRKDWPGRMRKINKKHGTDINKLPNFDKPIDLRVTR